EGITSRFLRTLIRPLLPSLELDDPVEGAPIRLVDAVREMHVPTSLDRLRVARERLTLDELRALHFRLHERRASERGTAPSILLRDERLRGLVRSLQFELTAGQRRAAWQLIQQLKSVTPMRQLLQGDVGSGKTVVALIAAYAALDAGYHVAWMAPTQLLARQLTDRLAQMLDPVGGVVRLVTAGQSAVQPAGPTLFVGTQALLRHVRSGTQFGLVVVDEQHRFGVRDRDELIQPQRGVAPHVLTMSATPIPRSLALTLFGELGCTTLTERPIMQQPVRTKLGNERTRPQVAEVLRRAVVQGRQAFIVVPRIERSEDGQLSLDEVLRAYQQLLPGVRFAPYHGQQSDEEQARVMDGYLSGQVDALVATTIVEVGIDIPNAAVMVIEEADRFGLAQLHQLRGRVGRGEHPGVCIVLTRSTESQATERLRAFTSSNDGFALAELDLKLRGPGELLGSEQSGMPRLKLASLLDPELGRQAQETVIQWQQAPPATLAGFLELYSAPMH
ncbi:MAG: DEAD/DEAH box helicase, partial [Patescibacteria group bacterium]